MARLTAEARVEQGARFLDARHPQWWQRVKPEQISFEHKGHDVLTQVYGNHWVGIGRHRMSLTGAEDLGFRTYEHWSGNWYKAECEKLCRAWQQEVTRRIKQSAMVVTEELAGAGLHVTALIHQGKRNTTSVGDHQPFDHNKG